jgi:hypothetical protein
MRRNLLILVGILIAVIFTSCDEKNPAGAVPLPGLAWDPNSLRLLSKEGNPAYNGYARMVQLKDHSLFVVYYNGVKGILGRRSFDYGETWGEAFVILANSYTHEMNNPEILELQDGSLLVSTNLRPKMYGTNQDETKRFQIGVIKSSDFGSHWSDLQILYTASWKFSDGCWEPKAIQLPSGEIQIYFSNEAPYTKSDEQNISMISSKDSGATWTTDPLIVSFRENFRDGMPTPILLQDAAEIILPIEDNGYHAPLPSPFKISIIRIPVPNGWQETVDGGSPQREYALKNILPVSGPYAGAPYLAQLPGGETILSYQSSFGREVTSDKELNYTIPYVAVGDAQARNFQNAGKPFDIPEGKEGLWNSVAALDNGEVVVLTSTNGFSKKGEYEVWMIKGKLK